MKRRYHYIISGRVQGVGYRFFTQDCAIDLGLLGWVKNLSDGRVEAEVEGEESQLAQMQQLLQKGPSLANVDKITRDEEPIHQDENEFEMVY
jgi:acylphosphatase